MLIQSKVFTGSPEEVQEQMTAFFQSTVVKIHGFAQSQSTVDDVSGTPRALVTATLLYVAYEGSRNEISGFSSR